MAAPGTEGLLRRRAAALRLPSPCAICGQWSLARPCETCLAQFARPRPRCRQCALPVAAGVARCGACLRSPPPFERAVAAVDYGFPWDALVARWKFGDALALTPLLAGLLRRTLDAPEQADAAQVELVVPMPLSEARLRERGYNQAALLARALDRRCDDEALLRWRDTPHQTGLHRDERQANLRGAFMPAPAARARLAGRHVALVDDVMTTGSSAAEASRALHEAGAARVSLWLLARTPE